MKILLIYSTLLATSLARPEPPSGYSYPVPAGPTLSLPGPSIGGSHGISSIGLGSGGSHDISQISLTTSGHGGSSYSSHGGSLGLGGLGSHGSSLSLGGHGSGLSLGGHGSSLGSFGSHGSSGGFSASTSFGSGGHGLLSGSSLGSSSFVDGSSFSGGSSSFSGGSSSFSGGSSSFLGGSSSLGSSASLGNLGGGSTLVQKHIYVHVPPPEPEDLRPQRVIPIAPAQKHYKIIFIKAPSAPTPTYPSIPLQPQNEEKTLVYVLVKKPDEAPELSIPAPIPTQPSKPEVYFIRYKTQKEANVGSGGFGGISSGSGLSGASLGGHGSIDESSLSLGGGSGLTSFSSSHGSSSSSSFVSGSSSSGGLTTSYGPPGHIPGPY